MMSTPTRTRPPFDPLVWERARTERLTRNQHILFRLGELIAFAEGAASFARRAARALDGQLTEKSDRRFEPAAKRFAQDKLHQRTTLHAKRLPVPPFAEVHDSDDVERFAERVQRQDVEFIELDKRPGHLVRDYPRLYRLFRRLRPGIRRLCLLFAAGRDVNQDRRAPLFSDRPGLSGRGPPTGCL